MFLKNWILRCFKKAPRDNDASGYVDLRDEEIRMQQQAGQYGAAGNRRRQLRRPVNHAAEHFFSATANIPAPVLPASLEPNYWKKFVDTFVALTIRYPKVTVVSGFMVIFMIAYTSFNFRSLFSVDSTAANIGRRFQGDGPARVNLETAAFGEALAWSAKGMGTLLSAVLATIGLSAVYHWIARNNDPFRMLLQALEQGDLSYQMVAIHAHIQPEIPSLINLHQVSYYPRLIHRGDVVTLDDEEVMIDHGPGLLTRPYAGLVFWINDLMKHLRTEVNPEFNQDEFNNVVRELVNQELSRREAMHYSPRDFYAVQAEATTPVRASSPPAALSESSSRGDASPLQHHVIDIGGDAPAQSESPVLPRRLSLLRPASTVSAADLEEKHQTPRDTESTDQVPELPIPVARRTSTTSQPAAAAGGRYVKRRDSKTGRTKYVEKYMQDSGFFGTGKAYAVQHAPAPWKPPKPPGKT